MSVQTGQVHLNPVSKDARRFGERLSERQGCVVHPPGGHGPEAAVHATRLDEHGRPVDTVGVTPTSLLTSVLDHVGLSGAAYAAPVLGGAGVGFHAEDLVTPASVMKIQVALTVQKAIASGALGASTPRVMPAERRTPGPTGISLMHDPVTMSVRDLVSTMLTISDNAATDELIGVVGLDAVNRVTAQLGMTRTEITSDLAGMLDQMAAETGFAGYAAMAAHDPRKDGPPTAAEITQRVSAGAALDPTRGTHTTAADVVRLLQAIWTDDAGSAEACAAVRTAMGRQLTRHRIASGFAAPVAVSAKSGGLLGVVRNEAGVVTFPDGEAYAVAVFTRRPAGSTSDPAEIDQAIGRIARDLVGQLRSA